VNVPRSSTTWLAVVALAIGSGGTASGAATGKVIGHAVRLKGTKIFYAHGTALKPTTISARVIPTPPQRVKVQWGVVCHKVNHADPAIQLNTAEKLGETFVHGVATVKLGLPYAKPSNCVATVYATLDRDGKLVVRLVQT
jgi:hypothetical protein